MADRERIQSSLNKPPAKVFTRQEVVESNLKKFEQMKQKQNAATQQFKEFRAAQKLRKQEHEDHLNMLVEEGVKLSKQNRQQALDEANIKRFHQMERVRIFNRAVQETYVQQYNMKAMEFKKEQQRIAKDYDSQLEEEMRCREKEALRQEQEKARQRRLNNKLLAERHVDNIKEKKRLREEEKRQEKEERCRLRDLDKLHAQELRDQAQKIAESKKMSLKCQMEEMARRKLHREKEAQRLIVEEKEREHVQFDIARKQQQRKDEQAERFRKKQIPKEIVAGKLAAIKQEQEASRTLREEAKFLKEVSEQNQRLRKQRMDREEKRAAMLKSISAHREMRIQEKEQKKKAEQKSLRDWALSQEQSDRLFLEIQKQKAEKTREYKMKLVEANATLTDGNLARLEQAIKEDHAAAVKTEQEVAEKNKQFLKYVQSELKMAADSGRNVTLLSKTATKLLPEALIHMAKSLPQDISEVDLKPTCLPPISNKGKLKSNNTLAAREAKTRQCSLPGIVEGSNYLSKDAGRLLPRLGNAHTHGEISKVNLKLTCLPPISNTNKLKSKKT